VEDDEQPHTTSAQAAATMLSLTLINFPSQFGTSIADRLSPCVTVRARKRPYVGAAPSPNRHNDPPVERFTMSSRVTSVPVKGYARRFAP
jgi:hypothetical protein